MIVFAGIAAYAIVLLNGYFAHGVISAFLPSRPHKAFRIIGIVVCAYLFDCVIYANDLVNIFGYFAGFALFMLVFFQGSVLQKLSVAVIIYPMLVSINFLSHDIGFQVFRSLPVQTDAVSAVVETASLGIRTALWYFCLRLGRKWPGGISHTLDAKIWLLLDSVCAAIVASVLIVLGFAPASMQITYPVTIASIVSVLGCVHVTGYIAHSVQTSYQLELLRSKHRYYEDKLREEERVRAAYHDMKNHLLLLRSEQNDEEAEKMTRSLLERTSGYEDYYKTGNSFLDVIIHDKAKAAKENDIDFAAVLHFADGGFIEPLDLSAIFGNGLDNAIEASLNLPRQDRLVTVKANRIRDMLAIVIENNAAGAASAEAPAERKTSKADNYFHGFGLRNIRQAVEKYDGECAIRQAGGRFVLSIVIPVP